VLFSTAAVLSVAGLSQLSLSGALETMADGEAQFSSRDLAVLAASQPVSAGAA
jgi:hypothetical protein